MLVSILALALIITALSVVNPIIYQKAADEFIPEKNFRALIVCICITVAVPVIGALIALLKNRLNYRFGKNVSMMLRTRCSKNSFAVIMLSTAGMIL